WFKSTILCLLNCVISSYLSFSQCLMNFLEVGQHIWERCDTAGALLKRGCPFDHLEDPRGSTVLLKNRKITFHPKEQRHKRLHRVVTQLQPQTVLLHLRPGEPQSFEVKFKQVKDYLIDLYYLMDLSFSMEDDLMNVKKLGADLMKEMKNITSDFRLGFVAFVGKTVILYINTPWPCTPPFTYHNILSLTTNGSLFTELVGGQRISSNLDSPEVGLNDLMQATMCERQIGWRNVTRLLVFSTDAVFHVAGDGKLSCIVLPNDGKCHLLQIYTFFRRTLIFFFTKEKKQKNVQIIFAVTEKVAPLYKQVSTGLAHLLYSHCKDHRPRHGEQGRRCSNISVDDEVSFNVSITAPLCVAASQRPCRFIIKPQGYSEEVEVLLSPICECSCQKDRVPHSPSCSHGNRTLECGACRCKAGRAGTFSECEQEESGTAVDSHLCRRDNASEVCSGHRKCICGRCVCQKSSKKPSHVYYGELCECSDFSCDQYRGLQCGGRGRCVWGECLCSPAFRGRAYECLSQDGQICGGSHCGTCICHDKRFQGPTCELCPSCPSICNLECVSCRAFSVGLSPNECKMKCAHLNLALVGQTGVLVTVAFSPGLCREKSFYIACKRECPSGPNVILITTVLSGSVVVLGVALLLLWKLLTSIHDHREFARFQRALEQRRWNRVSPCPNKSFSLSQTAQ
uniref:Integrin beta n=1 Tax=Astatotilapia calliptera TaxID=8154 RepID=A0A3P8PH13_ASTCA